MPTPLRLAARDCPFGMFTLADAERRGVDRFRVARACRKDLLVRLAPGLYRIADQPPHRLQAFAVPQRYLDGLRARSARPAMRAVLTGIGALAVQPGFTSEPDDLQLEPSPRVAVGLHRRVRLSRPPFEVHRCCWDRVVVTEVGGGLRAVEPARALADLTQWVRRDHDVVSLVDRARNQLFLTTPDLVDRWRWIETDGAARLIRLERSGVLEQESHGERRAHRLLFEGTGPLPDCQVRVLDTYRADFVFVSAGLIIEYFGKAVHRDRFEADLTRRIALEQAGWRVITIIAWMLRDHESLAAHIHEVRRTRERLIARGALPRPRLPMQPPRMRPLTTL